MSDEERRRNAIGLPGPATASDGGDDEDSLRAEVGGWWTFRISPEARTTLREAASRWRGCRRCDLESGAADLLLALFDDRPGVQSELNLRGYTIVMHDAGGAA